MRRELILKHYVKLFPFLVYLERVERMSEIITNLMQSKMA